MELIGLQRHPSREKKGDETEPDVKLGLLKKGKTSSRRGG